jgi:diguanylate cyclase (GGDEF)-like protein
MGIDSFQGEPVRHPASAGAGGVAPEESPPLRVILVGRTGLDGKLRLDPGLELVRVREPLEAVGELADPIDTSCPSRSVVIVAPDADPGGSAHDDAARATEFVSALRHVDPEVRVLRVEGANGVAPVRAGYDGVVDAAASPDVLRTALRGLRNGGIKEWAAPEPSAQQTPPAASREDVSPLIDAVAAPPASGPAQGDEALVRLLLQGRDITDAAIDLLRGRLPGHDLSFVSAGRGPAAGAVRPPEGQQEAIVGWRGRAMGRLRSRDLTLEELAPHATWLASWLALRDQHAQLREAAFTDPLTGAHNRRFFDHFLGAAIEQAARQRQSLTVLVFDIDNFKSFNDRFGHAAGDEILRETVRLLRSVVRPSDKVCRIGGDEFVVIFHEPTGPRQPGSRHPSSIGQLAKRFQDAIAARKFPKLGREAPGTLTISGGLATYPWDGRTATDLLARADELALQSKRAGKDAITIGPGAERECGGCCEHRRADGDRPAGL